MTLHVSIESNHVVDAIKGQFGPEGSRALNSAAGGAVMNAVQRHIRSYMRSKHRTARMLGATPTGHYEDKGAAAISMSADASGAEVRIPIPGISRAWNDITIRPGPGKDFLTLPKAAIAYGRKVAEVRALGWKVFRPAASGAKMTQKSPRRYTEYQHIYLGYKDDDPPTLLYTLVDGVVQRKDPSLLPSEDEIARTANDAIMARIGEAVRRARRAGARRVE